LPRVLIGEAVEGSGLHCRGGLRASTTPPITLWAC
jgi:hypothetical protein